MSINAKRFIASTTIVWIMLFITGLIPMVILSAHAEGVPAVANASPTPWWQQVEQFQALALKWIAMLTAITAALATFVGVVFTQYRNLKERIDRVSDRADVAVATAASATSAQAVTNVQTGAAIAELKTITTKLAPVIAIFVALSLCACGTVRTTDKNGNAQWHIRSNAATMDIVERGHGNFEFHATGLDNATPTTAALTGAQDIVNSVVTAAVAAYATHGLTGSAKLLTPAAPLGSSAFKSRNATPAALQAH